MTGIEKFFGPVKKEELALEFARQPAEPVFLPSRGNFVGEDNQLVGEYTSLLPDAVRLRMMNAGRGGELPEGQTV